MDHLTDLSDDDLFRRAQMLRLKAADGDIEAQKEATAMESEARRRFSMATTLAAPLTALPVGKRPWWRLW